MTRKLLAMFLISWGTMKRKDMNGIRIGASNMRCVTQVARKPRRIDIGSGVKTSSGDGKT
jgi:hypothetical protein